MADESQTEEKKEESAPQKSNKSVVIVLTVVVGIILVYGIVSNVMKATTGKVAENMVENAIEQSTGGQAEVDLDGGTGEMTVETEAGKFTAGKNEIPENFPQDLPLYPGAEIVQTISGTEAVSVVLSTGDTVSEAADYYKLKLTENDWTLVSTTTIENATVYGIEKEAMSGAVIISDTEGTTQISISLELAVAEE